MTALVARVAERIDRLAPDGATLLVAVSGGADSLALIELLHLGRERHRRPLGVVHVDHGIAAESSAVARMVTDYAAARDIPHQVIRLDLGARATETVARHARRAALRRVLAERPDAVVVLAHHRDDQIETVLLRVLGGSGPVGLAGMAPRRGRWIRPLLEVDRAELVAFADQRRLTPWHDPANGDPRHLRSWVRHSLRPLLASRLPDVDRRLGAVAQQAAELRRGLNLWPEQDAALAFEADSCGISVAAAALSGYRSAAQRLVIAALGRRLGVPLSARQITRVGSLATAGRSGAVVRLGPGLDAELAFGRLHIRRRVGFSVVALPRAGEIEVGAHRLAVATVSTPGVLRRDGDTAWLGVDHYRVRPWRRGDRVRPVGGTGSRSVAVLLREARVAAGDRPGWPVIVPDDDEATIVWVPGICRSTDRVPRAEEEALHVVWNFA